MCKSYLLLEHTSPRCMNKNNKTKQNKKVDILENDCQKHSRNCVLLLNGETVRQKCNIIRVELPFELDFQECCPLILAHKSFKQASVFAFQDSSRLLCYAVIDH